LIEYELTAQIANNIPLTTPGKARLSRLSRSFPVIPTIDLRPDARGHYYLLSISANDRTGLLYAVASVLAQHKIEVHTAKIMTLGERVEDVFLVEGPSLSSPRSQIQLETELLEKLKI
jgi:[protein-PII] uridylyltransferase